MTPSPERALSFCVVIPMYNEARNAEACVRAVTDVLSTFPERTGLIVVDDGSRDATPAILRELSKSHPSLDVVTHPGNLGYGGGRRSGIRRAAERGYEYALFMDSDLTNHPKYIASFVEKMRERVDVINASRYVPGGRVEGVPLYRIVISVVGNWLARTLMGLPMTDCTNGFRAARVELLDRLPLTESGFCIIIEELYYLRGLARTYHEIPNTLTARPDGRGVSSFRYRPKIFWDYLKYVLKAAVTKPDPTLARPRRRRAAAPLEAQ